MSTQSIIRILTFSVLTGITSSHAFAAFIIDESTGLASPDNIIDFGNNLFPIGTVIDTQFEGVTFGSSYAYNNTTDTFDALAHGYLENANVANEPGSISFSADVTAANFSWRTLRNTQTTFSAFNDNVLVEEFTWGTNVSLTGGRYFGFQDIVFDEIRLSIAHTSNNGFTLDNLEYVSAIPLPAAVWLFGSGLFGLVALARSKRLFISRQADAKRQSLRLPFFVLPGTIKIYRRIQM